MVPVRGKAAALVEEVVAAGGRLLITGRDRPNLSTLVQAANRFNKVPPGTRLASTWTRDGTAVYLNDLPDWARTPPLPIEVPAQLPREDRKRRARRHRGPPEAERAPFEQLLRNVAESRRARPRTASDAHAWTSAMSARRKK
jgi:hypothetical protein